MQLSLDQDMLDKVDNLVPGYVRLELGGIKPESAQQKCANGSSSVELASVLLLHLRKL